MTKNEKFFNEVAGECIILNGCDENHWYFIPLELENEKLGRISGLKVTPYEGITKDWFHILGGFEGEWKRKTK